MMQEVTRKRCGDAPHSKSTACEMYTALDLDFAKLWERHACILAAR